MVADCENKGVRVEVSPGRRSGWTEIPTTEVETWITKGGPVHMKRAAKVQFPVEWMGDNVLSTVEGAIMARVAYQFSDGSWRYVHVGWKSSEGMSGDEGVGVFWINDYAELLSGIPVTETFNKPTVSEAFTTIETKILTSLPDIPYNSSGVVEPNTEEEQTELLGTETLVLGGSGEDAFTIASYAAISDKYTFGNVQITAGSKEFVNNRHTVVDMIKWLSEQVSAKVHFVPSSDGSGVDFILDVIPTRHHFYQAAVIRETGGQQGHGVLSVYENRALAEIQPLNTMTVRGETGEGFLAPDNEDDLFQRAIAIAKGSKPPSEKFPVATAVAEPIKEAVGGMEVSETAQVSATTKDEAEAIAKTKLREATGGVGNGYIETAGAPATEPYDLITSYKTCPTYYEVVSNPVTYEVEEVKHTKKAGEDFSSELRVSIHLPDEDITVTSDMKKVQQ